MAANRYKSCPPPPPSLTRSSNLFPRYGKRDIFHGFGEGRKKLCAATGTYMDGSFSGKSTMHVVLMTWMEAVKFVRIRWFFFFFSSLSSIFFSSLPPSLFSSAMLRRIFDDRFEQGWNGSRVEWEMGIWMSDLEISSFSIRVKYEKNLSKWFFSFFFFVFACCATFFSFFIYLWIWFIGTSNISLQLVIISISQCCRKFTTFYLIKFVI